MARFITDLLPDVRLALAGCPEFLATHALTRSLSEFLDRSEAWREWLPVRVRTGIVSGLASWPNHLDDNTKRWARIKRIDKLRWYPTGTEIEFRTADQLQYEDLLWRTRTGTQPVYWTNEDEVAAPSASTTSQYQVRLYPAPAPTVDPTHGVEPRVVVVTDVVANMDLNNFDDQIPSVPDRVFYPWRDALVYGAMAYLYLMPNKDWSDQKLAASNRLMFEEAVSRAKSRADADYGNPLVTVRYGGI